MWSDKKILQTIFYQQQIDFPSHFLSNLTFHISFPSVKHQVSTYQEISFFTESSEDYDRYETLVDMTGNLNNRCLCWLCQTSSKFLVQTYIHFCQGKSWFFQSMNEFWERWTNVFLHLKMSFLMNIFLGVWLNLKSHWKDFYKHTDFLHCEFSCWHQPNLKLTVTQ